MASQLQIDANRRNAQKSTGPKTPEGRAAVRLNGVKHGLTAKILVFPGEDESAFTALLDSLEAEHAPATPSEEILVRQLAMAAWRLQRVYHLEASAFTLGRSDTAGRVDERFDPKLNDSERIAFVAIDDPFGGNPLAKLSLYESRLERSFYKALHELQRIRAERQKEVTNRTQSDVGQVPDLPTRNAPFLVPDPPVPANLTETGPPSTESCRPPTFDPPGQAR
jgi:hypothetical protein